MGTGNEDLVFGDEYTGTEPSSDFNVDGPLSSLFTEIGQTLNKVAHQGISTVGATVRTALANEIMNSKEGKAQIQQYKMQTFLQYLPWGILAIVAFIVGKRLLKM